MDIISYKVIGKKGFNLGDFNPGDTGKFSASKDVKGLLDQNIARIAELQDKLYADGKTGVLIIFQALDAAGKDGAIKHVMSGVNPQGVEVHSFKQPSSEELSHDYLWRAVKRLPARGKIAIFNRSYYEDVLVVKVHKIYETLNVPKHCKDGKTIERRYKHIRDFEDYLWDNGIVTVKFFLNLSKETQRKRFLERINLPEKNWKFSEADIKERRFWDDYQEAYQLAIGNTATAQNPWYVIPADKKWYTRLLVSEVLLDVLTAVDPKYPVISKEQSLALAGYKRHLDME